MRCSLIRKRKNTSVLQLKHLKPFQRFWIVFMISELSPALDQIVSTLNCFQVVFAYNWDRKAFAEFFICIWELERKQCNRKSYFLNTHIYLFIFWTVEPFQTFIFSFNVFPCLLLLPHITDVGMRWKSVDKEIAPSVWGLQCF